MEDEKKEKGNKNDVLELHQNTNHKDKRGQYGLFVENKDNGNDGKKKTKGFDLAPEGGVKNDDGVEEKDGGKK